jgi:predicted HicB family RNase H-like nuclease
MADQFVSFRIPQALHDEARERAHEEDRSVSSLVRRSIRTYLDEHDESGRLKATA